VHESLRKVPPHLVLVGVVLLAEQLRRPARRAGALEPADRLGVPVLVVQGERDTESAQQERALGLVQRPVVVPEAVGVAVDGELLEIGVQR